MKLRLPYGTTRYLGNSQKDISFYKRHAHRVWVFVKFDQRTISLRLRHRGFPACMRCRSGVIGLLCRFIEPSRVWGGLVIAKGRFGWHDRQSEDVGQSTSVPAWRMIEQSDYVWQYAPGMLEGKDVCSAGDSIVHGIMVDQYTSISIRRRSVWTLPRIRISLVGTATTTSLLQRCAALVTDRYVSYRAMISKFCYITWDSSSLTANCYVEMYRGMIRRMKYLVRSQW